MTVVPAFCSKGTEQVLLERQVGNITQERSEMPPPAYLCTGDPDGAWATYLGTHIGFFLWAEAWPVQVHGTP